MKYRLPTTQATLPEPRRRKHSLAAEPLTVTPNVHVAPGPYVPPARRPVTSFDAAWPQNPTPQPTPTPRVERLQTVTKRAPKTDYEYLDRLNILVADEEKLAGAFGSLRLDCTPDAVDLSRLNSGIRLLSDHDSSSPIGRVTAITVGSGQVTAQAEIAVTENARAKLEEINQGLRSGISPGFIITQLEADKDSDDFAMVVTKWQIVEISSSPIPRNPTARLLSRYSMNDMHERNTMTTTLESGQNVVHVDDMDGLSLEAGRVALRQGIADPVKRSKLVRFYEAFDAAINQGQSRTAAIASARAAAGI